MRAKVSLLLIFAIFMQATSCTWICIGFECNKEYITAELCTNRFTPAEARAVLEYLRQEDSK